MNISKVEHNQQYFVLLDKQPDLAFLSYKKLAHGGE
jgi:hypothetical protein